MRALSLSIQLLDGFDTTRENIQGALPRLFDEGGFEQVRVRDQLATVSGTLAFYSGVRPA
jgi:hypothetical protein